MRLLKFSITAAFIYLSALLAGSCSEDPEVDYRDMDYGYVQFKLYKHASYEPSTASSDSRATKPELDYLAEATKVNVTLLYNGTTISQTLTLTAANPDLAEFGLRSEKIKLLIGTYKVVTYVLYDSKDEPIYNGSASDVALEVTQGGLSVYDLTVNTTPRGKVQFTVIKDLSDFENTPETRAGATRQYTFDEVKYIDVTVRRSGSVKVENFTGLKTKFKIHFPEKDEHGNNINGEGDGYQTSSLTCDSLLSIEGGEWTLRGYKTYDANKILLEDKNDLSGEAFTVNDNRTTQAKIAITLYEVDEYIKDYYALYEIWKAMNGPKWYYKGQNFPRGINWNFNCDPDLWGNQPGVELHSNGRVAKLYLSDFGFGGKIPEQIGQLSELSVLSLGSHNDFNLLPDDPTVINKQNMTDFTRDRIKNHKKYLSLIHPATQLSEPLAFGLKERNISIPETALYKEGYSEKEVIDPVTGHELNIRPMDTNPGKLSNTLESIDEAIGKLQKLENFSIANSTIKKLPDAFATLSNCTDLEIYNCPEMTEFPMVITQMPSLVSVTIANNSQWSDQIIFDGLNALANGLSKEKIQILYCRGNKLKEVPSSFVNFKKLGLIDLAENQIEKLPVLGKAFAPFTIYFDNNKIKEFPKDENGLFCGYENLETFSATNNLLTKVPDIFTSNTLRVISTVDFSNNDIDGFENDGAGYKGLNTTTLTLVGNPKITKFPTALARSNSNVSTINLRGCRINEIPEGSFTGKYSHLFVSIDLSYNHLSKLPKEWTAQYLPYLSGIDLSYNRFSEFPWQPLNTAELTVFAIRGQRDENGKRCLRQWPEGLYNHKGLRGFFIGSNDIRQVTETISFIIYRLDISDNPNILFDAKDICYYYQSGSYQLIYDKTQDIRNCDFMLK